MKKTLLFILAGFVICLFITSCAQETGEEAAEKFSFSPEKPSPGESVTVTYQPEMEAGEVSDVTMQAYLYSKDWPEVKEVPLQKSEKNWEGQVASDPETRGILIKFTDEETVDNDEGRGYWIPFYDESGDMVAGALAGLAEARVFWGPSLMDIERDPEAALNKFQKEFEAHPELKAEFLGEYLQTLKNAARENWEDKALQVLDEVASRENLDEETLNPMVYWYRTLGNEEKAEEFAVMLREKYPEGGFVEVERFREVYEEKDLEKRMELARKFEEEYPESERLDTLHYLIVSGLLNQGKIQEMESYFEEHPALDYARVFNMAASKLLEQGKYPELALKLAGRGIDAVEDELNRPEEEKPAYYTRGQWEERIEKYSLAPLLDTRGELLMEQGKAEEAVVDMEKAVEVSGAEQPEINQHYAKALIQTGAYEKALERLSAFVCEGNASPEIREMLKTAYVEQKGSDEGFSDYLKGLEEKAREIIKAELQKEIMEKPAPDFTLEDLQGNQVSLSDLRGKTLVLDFWATLCGPSISSFPGIKRAVDKFQDDPSVEFLFINVEDKKKDTQNFIDKHNYPFHVLLDVNDEVINAFGVKGIPTKFVVDKNGNIRFKSVGYSGNDDKMVQEISLMIEMVK